MKNYLKSGLLVTVFAISLLASFNTSFSAQSVRGFDGIKTLEKDKVYEYDLNGDGEKEKLKYTVVEDEAAYTVYLKLYINNKLCMSRKDKGLAYTLQLCDLDKKDNYLDLYGYGTMDSGGISYSFFARYDKNNQYKYVNFKPNKIIKNYDAYSLELLHGNGKFDMMVDTPVHSDAIGRYYCYVPFQLKNNVISAVSTQTYAFNKFSSQYKYKAAKVFSVYDKAGSNKVAYKVKTGEKVTINALCVTTSGKAYFRVVNSKGKTGWIKSDLKNIFVERPEWG